MRRKKKNTRYIVVRPVRKACGFWKLKQNPPHTHMNVKALNELEREIILNCVHHLDDPNWIVMIQCISNLRLLSLLER